MDSKKKDIIILAGKGNEFEIQYKNRVLKHNDINYLKNTEQKLFCLILIKVR